MSRAGFSEFEQELHELWRVVDGTLEAKCKAGASKASKAIAKLNTQWDCNCKHCDKRGISGMKRAEYGSFHLGNKNSW
jgi:hypothetical protein